MNKNAKVEKLTKKLGRSVRLIFIGPFMNGYPMFSVTNIVQNVKPIQLGANIWKKVPRGIQCEKSSKDMASSRNLVSTIGAQASPKKGDGTGCPKG